MSSNIFIGTMSGTSLDGLDISAISIFKSEHAAHKVNTELLKHTHFPFDSKLKSLAQQCMRDKSFVDILHFTHLYNDFCVDSMQSFLKQNPKLAQNTVLIGHHGQTLWHHPQPSEKRPFSATLQVGSPTHMAQKTGINCVGNFRQSDLAWGGEAAPLMPFAHQYLFSGQSFAQGSWAVHNLGGISNISLFNETHFECAFDTGPANIWSDLTVQHFTHNTSSYDESGNLAKTGTVHDALFNELLDHPYFKKSFPKSTGHKDFGMAFLKPLLQKYESIEANNFLATICQATAQTWVDSYEHLNKTYQTCITDIICCGGGAYNSFLLDCFKNLYEKTIDCSVRMHTSQNFNYPPEAIESMGFAIMAWAFANGQNNCLAKATGAKQDSIGGELALSSDKTYRDKLFEYMSK